MLPIVTAAMGQQVRCMSAVGWQRLPYWKHPFMLGKPVRFRRSNAPAPRRYSPGTFFRPRLEFLEDRLVLSTLHVTDLGDNGANTLRGVVGSATTGDVIVFDVNGKISLSSEIGVYTNLTIQGQGKVILDGGGVTNLFNESGGTTLTLQGLTLQNGYSNSGGGGAVSVQDAGNLTVIDCYFHNNLADGNGGAIAFSGNGDLTVLNSTFANNASSFGSGGAIFASFSGNLSVTNSTFDNNSGDTSAGSGGAVDTNCTSGSILNCTFTNNVAYYGGAIRIGPGSITIGNSILQDNGAESGIGANIFGSFTSNNYNIIDDTTGSSFSPQANDQLGAAAYAKLGSLQNNGGPTPTIAVLDGSTAQNLGDPGLAGTLDQRGIARDAVPDVGAFSGEVITPSTPAVAPTITLTGATTILENQVYTLNVSTTLSEQATFKNFFISWGDGTLEAYSFLPTTLTHVYTDGPNYIVIAAAATFTDNSGSQSGVLPDVISTAKFDLYLDVSGVILHEGTEVAPNSTATLDIGDTYGLTGTLNRVGGTVPITFYIALYNGNPKNAPVTAVAFYDARVTTAGIDDTLRLVFHFPPQPAGTQLTLMAFDEATQTYVAVQGSSLFPNSLVVDAAAGTIILILDRTSFPQLTSLTGTVFTVGVSTNSSTSTSVSTSVASSSSGSPTSTFTQQASFQVGSSVTLALSPSFTAGTVSAMAANGGGGGLSEEEARRLVELFNEVFGTIPLPHLKSFQGLMSKPGQVEAVPNKAADPAVAPAAPIKPVAAEENREEVLNELMRQIPEEDAYEAFLVEGGQSAWMLPMPLLGLLARRKEEKRKKRALAKIA